MRHLQFYSLQFEQHFTLQSHTLNLEGCAETVFLTYHIPGVSAEHIFHANQNVLKKCLNI